MQIEKLYELYKQSSGITTDSRNIKDGNIFFALKGDRFNGNQFAERALQFGAAYTVIDEWHKNEWQRNYAVEMILVENVLTTLQQLAAYHRQQLNIPIIAITGSNGKTTTKELVAKVLSKKFRTHATFGNLNNHIGIPLTLLSMNKDTQIGVIEMGANHQKEIADYCTYTDPDFGLITNVGLAHLEGFGGPEGVVKGKSELYQYLEVKEGVVFVNSENEKLLNRLKEIGNKNIITYGSARNAHCRGEIKEIENFLSVIVFDADQPFDVNTNLIGTYNFENVMAAICVGQFFGIKDKAIAEAIEDYSPTNNRSQQVTSGSNTFILDAYNANPSSMREALNNFEKVIEDNKGIILGEMMELGTYSREEHQKIAQQVMLQKLQKRIFVGTGFGFLKGASGVNYFETTEEAKEWFLQNNFEHYTFLIKGSRKNQLESIIAQGKRG